jgi:signal peptidase II
MHRCACAASSESNLKVRRTLQFNRVRNWAFLIGTVLFLLVVDQGTKWLVRQNLAVGEAWAPIPALAKIFTITYVRNTGVSFGQLPGVGWLFMFVNVAVVIGVIVYYPRIANGQWLLRSASALIMAGALGNVIDRLRTAFLFAGQVGGIWNALPHAYVTDFVDFKIWPVWNVADMCVVGGVAILAWILWQEEKKATHEVAMTNETMAKEQ